MFIYLPMANIKSLPCLLLTLFTDSRILIEHDQQVSDNILSQIENSRAELVAIAWDDQSCSWLM
jgi:hypothetical protein